MRFLATSSLFALVGLAFATPAFAVPTFNVTASEVISTVPPRFKTTFTLQLVGYNPPAAWYGIELTSNGQGPAVSFHDVECPGYPWSCGLTSTIEAHYYVDGGGLGGPAKTFSVVTDQQTPCVEIRVPDMLLSKTPVRTVQNDYVINACLAVDMPTPAAQTTWGTVKAMYR